MLHLSFTNKCFNDNSFCFLIVTNILSYYKAVLWEQKREKVMPKAAFPLHFSVSILMKLSFASAFWSFLASMLKIPSFDRRDVNES